MPPRTPQKKLPPITPTKSTPNPPINPSGSSQSEPELVPKLETSTKSESSESSMPKIGTHRETFDLNEPWLDANELQEIKEEVKEEAKQVVENESEIVVKEVDEKIEQVPVREKKKQKEFEVFVGGLDRDAVEEDLEKVFKKIGDVMEVRLVKNKYSHKNKGFAFVRFATIEQAKKAAAELNYTQVRGKVCEVTRNNDNETLHLGNICTTWTRDTLVETLQPYELENLEDVHLIEDPKDRRKNRGYAFLNFSTHMDAVAACNKLQKGSLYLGTTVRADIAFAKSAVEPDEEIMAQVKSVFLDGLPPSWDESQVQQLFQKYGDIDNVQLARNMPSAKRRDFGFISFRTREAALACIDAVNKDGIVEGSQKVSVRATLRKPLQRRTSSATGGWRGYNTDNYDGWGGRSSGVDRSYTNRQNRTVEPLDRGRGCDRRTSGYSRYSSRRVCDPDPSPVQKYGHSRYSSRDVYEAELSPVEEYGAEFRRGSVRQVPTTSHSRSRGPYLESSSSSSRRSTRNYEDFPTCYSSHGQYEDEIEYDYYENNSTDTYDYPIPSRMKRPYSAVADDQLVSRTFTRRSRSGELDIDMDAYSVRGVPSSYEEYPRSMPDVHYGYESMGYERQYSSGRAAPRSYDY